jgi:peroxiredoxin Q/BCP
VIRHLAGVYTRLPDQTQERKLNRLLRNTGLFLTAGLFSLSLQAAVEAGDPAPDFSLIGSDGEQYTLSELRGKHVVIAFFPKAFTGG